MTTQVLKLTGNYAQMIFAFKLPQDFIEPSENYQFIIEVDLPRTIYLSRKHDYSSIVKIWHQLDVSDTYTQGNISNSLFGSIKPNSLYDYFSDKDAGLIDALYATHKTIGLGFIDEAGCECGFAITYQIKSPNYFTLSYMKNNRLKPNDRHVICFQSTDEKYYPPLLELFEPVTPENKLDNAQQELLQKSQLKKSLLNIKDLPIEIKYFMMDIIKENGQLDIKQLPILAESLRSGKHTNSSVQFTTDLAIAAIKRNQFLCQYILKLLIDLEKTQKDFPAIIAARRQINRILARITACFTHNSLNFSSDGQSYIEQAQDVQIMTNRALYNHSIIPRINHAEISQIINNRQATPVKASSEEANNSHPIQAHLQDMKDMTNTYQSICSSLLRQLPNIEPLTSDHLRSNIIGTLCQIRQLQTNIDNMSDELETSVQELRSIKAEIQSYLTHDSLNLPYTSLLNSIRLTYQYYSTLSHTSFTQRHTNKLMVALCLAAISSLSLIALAIAATSTMVALSIALPFGIGCLVLLGLMAYKEYQYQNRNILASDRALEQVTQAQTKNVFSLNTFNFYINNLHELNSKPAVSNNEISFFKQVTSHCLPQEGELGLHSPNL